MKINPLIDRNYSSCDILEEVFEVAEWLQELKYLVPIDEHLLEAGIVTLEDINKHPFGAIKDCDIAKPKVSPEDTLFDVLEIMQANQLHYLPVFEQDKFVGVIAMVQIAKRLAEHVLNAKKYYQLGIDQIKMI